MFFVKQVENTVRSSALRPKPIRIAVMGCAVNGPGEAREADIGIAGGKGFGILFKKGKVLRRIKEKTLVKALLQEIRTIG